MALAEWSIEEHGFRGLYERLLRVGYDRLPGLLLSGSVLAPAQGLMEQLDKYRRAPMPGRPARLATDQERDLQEFYALSRINDFLLFPFLGANAWHTLADLRVRFFTALGFRAFHVLESNGTPTLYSPFHHEIVDVTVSDAADAVRTRRVTWPGLRFGNLLFARAGVSVEAPPELIDEFIAERSILYFAYRRHGRRTCDQSFGWGHNSQWKTSFHRFYEDAERFYFNVDGFLDITSPTTLAESIARPGEGFEDPARSLPIEYRRELLIHRHFITCRLTDKDRWPWNDTLTLDKGRLVRS